MADALVVKFWPDRESFKASGEVITDNSFLVDVPAILK